MMDFVFETTPKLVCEVGAAARLGEMAKDLGIRRALIVTDAGLVAAGLLEPVEAGFKTVGTACALFCDVLADPPEESVALAVQAARAAGADGVIGFGGGSSLDTAKLVALLAGTPQDLPDIYGIGLAKGPRLPLIQVPTTAGTGSEVTPIAIVTTPTSEKKGVVSSLLYPDLAVLDARLTLGLPPRVTAMTGIDAMVHAIEAYTTRHKKNPLSDSLALRALGLLGGNIRAVIADGRDVAARAAMLQGSLLAGIAFANAPVGAVHALAYPLGGHFHVPHGLSNALMLGPVLEFNRPAAGELYAELAPAIMPGRSFATPDEAVAAFIDAMRDLVAAMPMEQQLEQLGVRQDDLPMLAADAMKVQRLLINNRRDVRYDDALDLYRQAW
ncbi:iron-containing alcohol dehydrogenase [Azospirillum melinis]|uniref:Iron-containing alcohol dehydrogenase n=1 Tax=Azospirillum melinis TaxID=328839 RepID=A0ABX2KER6_9PROT|nr:iron-containing alcohol dehydrogenase [Azospirillum melinis]MBP2310208.1 alcohol dehydrogenase class IV [Azospirillum melinis]NUB02088.1 iron-containing alcohol dehydrogenase [Azospirillum melinis]